MTFEAMGFVKPVDIDARWDEGGVFSRTFSLRRAYGVDGPNFGAIVSRSLHFTYIWCVRFYFKHIDLFSRRKKKKGWFERHSVLDGEVRLECVLRNLR